MSGVSGASQTKADSSHWHGNAVLTFTARYYGIPCHGSPLTSTPMHVGGTVDFSSLARLTTLLGSLRVLSFTCYNFVQLSSTDPSASVLLLAACSLPILVASEFSDNPSYQGTPSDHGSNVAIHHFLEAIPSMLQSKFGPAYIFSVPSLLPIWDNNYPSI